MELTQEKLRDLSVAVVEDFLNNKTPLTEAVTKQASLNNLNPEQITRLAETSNNITYLKLLKTASDRTFEFPMADSTEVITNLKSPNIEKKASAAPRVNPLDLIQDKPEMEKVASFEPAREQLLHELYSQYNHGKIELEKLAYEKIEILAELGKVAERVSKDPMAHEKLAEVCDEQTYKALTKLSLGQVKEASHMEVFRDKDLEDAKRLSGLYKRAKLVIEEHTKVAASVDKARGILKQAAETGTPNPARSGLGSAAASLAGEIPARTSGLGGRVLGGMAGVGIGTISGSAKLVGRGAKKLGIMNLMGATTMPKSPNPVWKKIHGE